MSLPKSMASWRSAALGLVCVAWSFGVRAQESGSTVWHHAAPFRVNEVAMDDARRAEAGELELYGRKQELVLDLADLQAEIIDGRRVKRVGLISTGAQAIELLLRDVRVPEGAHLRLLSAQGEELSKPMTLELPTGVEECSSPMVHADSVVFEYSEPEHSAFQGRLVIDGLVHAYRLLEDVLREGPCHVNVACTPESTGWQGPIAATVRISVVTPQGNAWCSGTLMNNVRQDCTPYLLTAFHCARTPTTAQLNQFKFYFNFQYANCNGGTYDVTQFIQGAQRVAYSNDYTPQLPLGGSDFMLLRAHVAVPAAFQPYWAGWDATNLSAVTADGVGVHHPTGAPKRISTFTQSLSTGHPQSSTGLQSHYRVYWAATTNGHGITESGSSGSGLFKPHAALGPLLIGTLTGSSTGMNCTNNNGTTYYGKMSYHWTNNPNTVAQKLKNWLDPDATGTLLLGGSSDPCGAQVGVHGPEGGKEVLVMPNPTSGQVTLELPHTGRDPMEWEVRDLSGRSVARGSSMAQQRTTLELGHLPDGLYTVQLLHGSTRHHTRVSIQH